MCTRQKVTLPDGSQVDGGYMDCMSTTCSNSVRYNPPPMPDNPPEPTK